MIQGLAGVIIWTVDLDRLVAFYRDTLGLTPHSVRPDFVAFSFGDVRLSLGRHSEVTGPSRDPYRIMVNLAVEDIQAVTVRLRQRGVAFVREPEQEQWGGWVATFRDPDGNLLQLLQQPHAQLDRMAP
ncbi:MAG TPA: VOC family protein [Dehalococcoidia bacterium]|nr:VOC family protein [Dehalococcoidia bacterium]